MALFLSLTYLTHQRKTKAENRDCISTERILAYCTDLACSYTISRLEICKCGALDIKQGELLLLFISSLENVS